MQWRVRSVAWQTTGFSVSLEDGRILSARRLLIATGLVDQLPDVPGLRERWGRDVVHCPYCHGWEVRDQAVGVLVTGSMAVHQALLFRQLASDVVLFTHTAPSLDDEQAERLAARDIHVAHGRVAGLEVTDDHLTGLRLDNGSVIRRQVMVVGSPVVARSQCVGVARTPADAPSALSWRVHPGWCEVPGVWVAGNVMDLSATVIGAAAQGVMAAAAINADLVAEDTQQAVITRRDLALALVGWAIRLGEGQREEFEAELLPPPEELRASELRVLRYLPTNLTRPDIARELYISINTINTHIRSIYSKLSADDRSSAVARR